MIISKGKAYKSINVVLSGERDLRIDEGMLIKFTVDTGEVKEGFLDKISSKKKSFSFLITPNNEAHKEIWTSDKILPDTLEIIAARINEE